MSAYDVGRTNAVARMRAERSIYPSISSSGPSRYNRDAVSVLIQRADLSFSKEGDVTPLKWCVWDVKLSPDAPGKSLAGDQSSILCMRQDRQNVRGVRIKCVQILSLKPILSGKSKFKSKAVRRYLR